MESNSVCNHTSDNKIGRPRGGSPICKVLLPINHENYNFREKEEESSYKKRGKFALKYGQRRRKYSKVTGKNTKASARAHTRNYNFECDWLI